MVDKDNFILVYTQPDVQIRIVAGGAAMAAAVFHCQTRADEVVMQRIAAQAPAESQRLAAHAALTPTALHLVRRIGSKCWRLSLYRDTWDDVQEAVDQLSGMYQNRSQWIVQQGGTLRSRPPHLAPQVPDKWTPVDGSPPDDWEPCETQLKTPLVVSGEGLQPGYVDDYDCAVLLPYIPLWEVSAYARRIW